MSANCARPGCGHGHVVARLFADRLVIRCPERISESPYIECSCPSYRTPEQQQAWDEARLALGPAVTEVPARVVKRLLELYP